MRLKDEIREARLRAGFSQNTLARLAKVPRSQLRKLEEGGNVTLATVQKILDQLPGVELTLSPTPVDTQELEEALQALLTATQRLLTILGGLRRVEKPDLEDKLLEVQDAMLEHLEKERTSRPPSRFKLAQQMADMIDELKMAGNKPKKMR